MMQVPDVTPVTVDALMVQVVGVRLVKVTGREDVAVALTEVVLPTASVVAPKDIPTML